MKLGLIIFVFIVGIIVTACSGQEEAATEEHKLEYLGPKDKDGDEVFYHTIPFFAFENQDGEMISSDAYDGKIHIADFFFSHCPSICPQMTSQMKRVQAILKDEDVEFISFTVDPKRDSVQRLKHYTEKNSINTSNWNFLTGTKQDLYQVGQEGYLLTAIEDDGSPEGFLHSQMFVLVDKNKHIRGVYDGTITEEVDQLIEDFKLLKEESKE